MSQIGRLVSLSPAALSSLGHSMTAGRYGVKVSSSIRQNSVLCASLPILIGPVCGEGVVLVGKGSAQLLTPRVRASREETERTRSLPSASASSFLGCGSSPTRYRRSCPIGNKSVCKILRGNREFACASDADSAEAQSGCPAHPRVRHSRHPASRSLRLVCGEKFLDMVPPKKPESYVD